MRGGSLWWTWSLGFAAGAAVATWITLSCAVGRAQSAEVAGAIHLAAITYDVPESRLRCLAWRESGFLPFAYNRAGYHGLFQFSWSTWQWAAARAGMAATSPYDPWAAAQVAAWLGTHPELGGWRHWPPARGCGLWS